MIYTEPKESEYTSREMYLTALIYYQSKVKAINEHLARDASFEAAEQIREELLIRARSDEAESGSW